MNVEQAKSIINALRNGTAPSTGSHVIGSGRELEHLEYNRCLDMTGQGQSLVKIITGDFGVGKSFLVESFKETALNQDFVVASLKVNNGFRMNKIDDFYYAIMHNLYIKSDPLTKTSFNDLFDLWIENLQNAPFPDRKRYEINTVCQELSKFNMNYARAFLSFMRARIQKNSEMLNVTTAWLTGEKNIPYEMKQKYDLVGYVDKTNSLDFLKAFVKLITLLDYKGLVIFIDEIDLLVYERSDLRMSAYQNLKYLIDLTGANDLKNTLFVFSGTPEVFKNEEKGILSLEPLAQRLNFTHYDAINPNDFKQTIIPIQPLGFDHFKSVTQKISHLYTKAHDKPISQPSDLIYENVIASVDPDSYVTRHYITELIKYLDNLETQ